MTNKCNICKNKAICKYKEEYEKEFNEVEKLDSSKRFPLTLDCIHFRGYYEDYEALLNGTSKYTGIAISSGGETVVNKCEGCQTYERIKNGEVVVGDQCYWCQNNPNKVTCGDTVETISINNVGTCK